MGEAGKFLEMFKRFFRIRRTRRKLRKRTSRSRAEHAAYKEQAFGLVQERLIHFNTLYNFTYHRISIRNQSSRWGSCSRRGNLSFNYRITLLPPELADYIIIHELCHLGEFNHSKKFWNLVALTVPNWPKLRMELREHGKKLF